MSWRRVALRTVPYPDIIWLDLELIGLGELPHDYDLTT